MARQNLIWDDGFERTSPEDKYTAQQQWLRDYSIQSSTSIVREGLRSARFEHRRADQLSGGYRTEFQSDANFGKPAEAWYGFSIYFENWSTMNVGEHIMQFHPTVSGGSASLGIYTNNNTFHVRLNPEGDSSASTLKDGKQIVSNKWYDIVMHVKWAATGGIVQVWIDGEPYVNYTGPTLTRGGIPYFKVGINRWGSGGGSPSNDRVFYVDALRIGNAQAEYKDVAPGEVSTPPPVPNQPPIVDAGVNSTITLPDNSIILVGSASDSDGTIKSYQWTKVSGGTASIISPNSATTAVTNLAQGSYVFRLTATDDDLVTSADDVVVTVLPTNTPPPPVKTVSSVIIRYSDGSSEEIVK